MNDPIIILTAGRSGSSMIAGVFAAHGVWKGKTFDGDHTNPKGTFENIALKQLIKDNMGWDFLEAAKKAPPLRRRIEEIARAEGYKDGPWMFKHGAQYRTIWDEFKPKFVFIRRPIDDVLRSYERCKFLAGRYTTEEIEWIVRRSHDVMDIFDGADVYTNDVVNGDYSSLEKAFDYCGIEFNPILADGFIDKTMWNEGRC